MKKMKKFAKFYRFYLNFGGASKLRRFIFLRMVGKTMTFIHFKKIWYIGNIFVDFNNFDTG